jgi:mRNA-decapping enzyme subunit 2
MNYKGHVPVRGVIMLNEAMDKCVMVKGWKGGASWSFPRGKIEKNETDIECAEREAWEETGVIVEGLVLPENKLEHRVHGKQEVWMYVIPGIPEDTKFEAKTRNEISKIDWHSMDKLPGWHKSTRKGGKDINNTPVKPSKYYLIYPFVILLRQWMDTKGKQWKAKQAAAKQQEMELAAQEADTTPSAASLKNLLGIGSMGGTPQLEPAQNPFEAQGITTSSGSSQEEKSKALFQMLKGGTSAESSVSSPTQSSQHNNVPRVTGSYQASPIHPTIQPQGQRFQTPMQTPGVWHPDPQSHPSDYLPTPPPTSRFAPSATVNQMTPTHPRQGSYPQTPHMYLPQGMQQQQQQGNTMALQYGQQYGQQMQQAPPTTSETYPPRPHLSRDQSTLLGILKSAEKPLSPPATTQTLLKTPSPPNNPFQAPSTPQAIVSQSTLQQTPHQFTPGGTRTVSNPLQAHPPSGPRHPHQNRHNTPQRGPRAATAQPANMYPPPQRPGTVQPTAPAAGTPQSAKAVMADVYAKPSPVPEQKTLFTSKNNDQDKQNLLSLFQPSSPAPAPAETKPQPSLAMQQHSQALMNMLQPRTVAPVPAQQPQSMPQSSLSTQNLLQRNSPVPQIPQNMQQQSQVLMNMIQPRTPAPRTPAPRTPAPQTQSQTLMSLLQPSQPQPTQSPAFGAPAGIQTRQAVENIRPATQMGSRRTATASPLASGMDSPMAMGSPMANPSAIPNHLIESQLPPRAGTPCRQTPVKPRQALMAFLNDVANQEGGVKLPDM